MTHHYSSVLLERAVDEFAKLPGIGRKTALRLVLHLLKLDEATVEHFANSITTLRHDVKHCSVCHNISDEDVCTQWWWMAIVLPAICSTSTSVGEDKAMVGTP